MEFQKKLEQNVYKDYIFTFLSRFDVTSGIWMLYLAFKGLTLFEIGLMETVYHVSSFILEIPTGAIADIYGRKTSRILGRVFATVAAVIMVLGNSIFAFAISFVFTALGNNLESGAGEALLYDSLKEVGSESKFLKIKGKKEVFFQLTLIISLVLGGYIGTFSYNNVYKVAAIIAFVGVIQALTFTEPTIGKVDRSINIFETFFNQLKKSIEVVKNDREIVKMVVALELFSTFFVTEYFYLQNLLKSQGNTELQIGIVLAIAAGCAALSALQAHRLEAIFKLKGILTLASMIAIVGFWLMTINGFEKYAFVMLATIETVLFITVSDYINKLIPSQQRATVLSFQSMVFSFFMIILFPIVGRIGDVYGLSNSFKVIAVISTISLVVLIYLVKKNK